MLVEYRANASSGVWQSPAPLPQPYLVVSVTSCQSGTLLLYWSSAINTAPPPASQPPDARLTIGQTAQLQTGLSGQRTLYICDSNGNAFDAQVAASDSPVAISATPPTQPTPPPLLQTAIPANAYVEIAVPIDSNVTAVELWSSINAGLWYVLGAGSLADFGQGSFKSRQPVIVRVSGVLDSQLSVQVDNTGLAAQVVWILPRYDQSAVVVTQLQDLTVVNGATALAVIPAVRSGGALRCASYSLGPAAGVDSTIVVAVAGQTITVYGYEFFIDPGVPATLGVYRCLMQDSTKVQPVANAENRWASDSGLSSLRAARSIPQGLSLPVGAGLIITTLAANAGAADIIGVVDYTQA